MDMVSILIMTTPTLPTTAPVITEYNIVLTDRNHTTAVMFLTSPFPKHCFYIFGPPYNILSRNQQKDNFYNFIFLLTKKVSLVLLNCIPKTYNTILPIKPTLL
jgi:hypothetical protein